MSQLSRTAAVASPAFGSPSLYGKTDPAASLPRNLYILNLPLDLAQYVKLKLSNLLTI